MHVYDKNGLRVVLDLVKHPSNPQARRARAKWQTHRRAGMVRGRSCCMGAVGEALTQRWG